MVNGNLKHFIKIAAAVLSLSTIPVFASEKSANAVSSCEKIPHLKESIVSLVEFHIENVESFKELAKAEHLYQKYFNLKGYKNYVVDEIKSSDEYWFESSRNRDIKNVESVLNQYHSAISVHKNKALELARSLSEAMGSELVAEAVDNEEGFVRYMKKYPRFFGEYLFKMSHAEFRATFNSWALNPELFKGITTEYFWGAIDDLLYPYFRAFGKTTHLGDDPTQYVLRAAENLKSFQSELIEERPPLPEDNYCLYVSNELMNKIEEYYSAILDCRELKLLPAEEEYQKRIKDIELEMKNLFEANI